MAAKAANSVHRAIFLTDKVYLSPEQEELSFVQYSIARWTEENNK